MKRSSPKPMAEPIRVLVVMAREEERERLCRRLADPRLGLRLFPVADWAQAEPYLIARQADLILGDLAAFDALPRASADNGARLPAPFCLLVPPGAEQEASRRLNPAPDAFLLQSGDYGLLLPVLLRGLRRRPTGSGEALARIIRHEVNNPLTGVLGNAELLLAEGAALPLKTRQRLATIIQLAVRLRDVVRALEERLNGKENPPDGNPISRRALSARFPRPLPR